MKSVGIWFFYIENGRVEPIGESRGITWEGHLDPLMKT